MFITEKNKKHMIYPVSQKVALQNFLRYFESLISDYRNQRFTNFGQIKTISNLKLDETLNSDGIPTSFITKMKKSK